MNRPLALLAILATVGCGGRVEAGADDSSGAESSESDSTGSGTSGGDEVEEVTECGTEPACPVFSGPYGCADQDSCGWTEYLDEHVCGLSLLAGGGPGLINYSGGCEGECMGELVLLRAGGTAVRQYYYQDFDNSLVLGHAQECTLKEASTFEDCLAAYDVECLELDNWFVECTAVESFSCAS
jgi:hypothetical protein